MVDIGTCTTGSLAVYRIVVNGASPLVTTVFPGAVEAGEQRVGEYRTAPLDLESLNDGLARLIAGGVQIVAVVPERSRLETAFRAAVGADR